MKKTIIALGTVVLALVACNKESKELPVNEQVQLTFTSESVETKTAWDADNSAIVWTSGDRIRVGYTLDGTWMTNTGAADFNADPIVPAKFYASNGVAIDSKHANRGTFSVPSNFSNSPSGSAVFYSVYPSSCMDLDASYAPSVTVNIKANQTPGANTFDKEADIMVGQTDPVELEGSFPATPMALEWNRVVAHADITFKDIPVVDDASVDKITLTFNDEAKVVGTIYMNVTTGEVTNTSHASNQLILKGDNLSLNNGSVEAWASVLPAEFTSVDIAVKTDVATYTRSISDIYVPFKKNARNTLTFNMASATREINSNLIEDGYYVLAVKSGDQYYAISSAPNGSSNRRDRSVISDAGFNPDNYSATSPYSAQNYLIWTITNVTGGVKINLAGDESSYMKYGNNTIPLGSDGAVFEVSHGTEGTYMFTNNSRYICMNGENGFGCYASNDTYIKAFYVIPAMGEPVMNFSDISKTAAADASSVAFTYTSLFLTDTPEVTVTADEGGMISSTSIASGTLTVNLNENTTSNIKTATLSVSATGVSPIALTIKQAAVVSDAEDGDILWAEDFTGFEANAIPAESNASSTVFGGGVVTYACTGSSNGTKVYTNATAGGVSPELLIKSGGGTFTVSGIPTGNATGLTLSFKSNNGAEVSSSTDNVVVGSNIGSGNNYIFAVTLPSGTKTLSLTFTNNGGSNTRVDEFSLVVGAPIPGISVTTNDATGVSSAEGTTATLNGKVTLINGALNASITEAGFYYKESSSAGNYTKVTCEAAPTTATSFSFNLTGLSVGATYTYYAYAVYDNGSEVLGDATEKEFTTVQSGSSGSKTYTLTITSADLVVLDDSVSGAYDKYKGDQTFTAVADDDTEMSVVVNITDVMPATGGNAGKIQVKKTSGTLYNKTDLGSISSITVATLSQKIGTSQNPSSNAGSGGYFKLVNSSSGAAYVSSITIVFVK